MCAIKGSDDEKSSRMNVHLFWQFAHAQIKMMTLKENNGILEDSEYKLRCFVLSGNIYFTITLSIDQVVQNGDIHMAPKLNAVDEVVGGIISNLPLKTRVSTANLSTEEIRIFELLLGNYIRQRLHKMDTDVNLELMKDCLEKTGETIYEVDAALVILRKIWDTLRKTHRLRVIK